MFFKHCLKLTEDLKKPIDTAKIHKAYGSALTNVVVNMYYI